jgi:hypothetical protein
MCVQIADYLYVNMYTYVHGSKLEVSNPSKCVLTPQRGLIQGDCHKVTGVYSATTTNTRNPRRLRRPELSSNDGDTASSWFAITDSLDLGSPGNAV